MIDDLFNATFGLNPETKLFTPGRVNLIGEHTDYNGGMVLPAAIELGLDIALSRRSDNIIRIVSDKFEEVAERQLSDNPNDEWSDYAAGAVILANETGLLEGGADIAIKTSLPFGAGLSSSAAVIVGILKAARHLANSDMSDAQIAVLARRVENEFIGMPCGIMDQMAVALARPGQALALNTQTLEYELIDLPGDYRMTVIHSGVFRQLSAGRYKIRKEECDEIKRFLMRDDICQIDDRDFQMLSGLPETLKRRARHCMSEHKRTVEAISRLKLENFEEFGRLMNESHISMKDDFEITLRAIDELVESALDLGATGARMTGGGFGGCIVACVKTDEFVPWRDALLERHSDAFFVC